MLFNSDAAKAQSTARSWKARKTMIDNVHEKVCDGCGITEQIA